MEAKILVAGIALVGTIVASMAGGAPSAARADTTTPSVTADGFATFPDWTGGAYGTGFTPGGAVHIDLEFGPNFEGTLIGPYNVVASTDTRAARTTYVPNGHGIVFTRAGGYFNATLTVAPTNPLCGGTEYFFYVVATDEATGRTASSLPTPGWCNK